MNPGVDVAYTGVLPHASAVANSVSATAGDVARPAHDLDQRHQRRRIEEVHADDPVRDASSRRASAVIEIDDVFDARMHSASTTFSTRSNSSRFAARSSTIASIDELRDADVGQRDDGGDPADRGVGVGAREPALGDQLVERFGDAFLRGVARADARVVQLDAMAVERGDLRDAGAHRAGADDGDGRILGSAARGGHRIGSAASIRPVKRGGRLAANAATPSR